MNQQLKAQMVKHALMITTGVFFFAFTRLGMFNKLFFWLRKSHAISIDLTRLYSMPAVTS